MRTATWGLLGPCQRQFMLWATLGLLTWLGRWVQGGDRPIAVPLRLLYATFIMAALVYVWRDLVGNFRHIGRWIVRVARRARRRPMLGLYLLVVVGCGGGVLTVLMAEELGQMLATLVLGGSRDIVGFDGDNSRDVQGLLMTLIWMSDLAVAAGAGAKAWWWMERQRLAAVRKPATPLLDRETI